MDNVIRKAIDGGWSGIDPAGITKIDIDSLNVNGVFHVSFFENESHTFSYNIYQQLMNPGFLKGLGKACDWSEDEFIERGVQLQQINLSESWISAVEYLKQVTNV